MENFLNKVGVQELSDAQRKILFSFAENKMEEGDSNYITKDDYKTYHLHEKIRTQLEMEEDYFYLDLKRLFIYGYLDLINEEFYFMEPKNIKERLNQIPLKELKDSSKCKSTLSKYGYYSINNYILGQQNESMHKIEDFNNKMESFTNDIKRIEKLISNFNGSILTIITLLVAMFSFIGINLNAIKYFELGNNENLHIYLGTIIAINVSLVFTIYAIFYFLNKLVYNNDAIGLTWKRDWKFILPIIALILVSFLLFMH